MGRDRWTSRLTIEECRLVLCVNSFLHSGIFDAPLGSTNDVSWPSPDVAFPLGRMKCLLFPGGPTGLRIIIPQQQIRMDTCVEADSISITTTRPHFGGRHFWFQCDCGRRCGRLYLPPGRHVFRCRICLQLDLPKRSGTRSAQVRFGQ